MNRIAPWYSVSDTAYVEQGFTKALVKQAAVINSTDSKCCLWLQKFFIFVQRWHNTATDVTSLELLFKWYQQACNKTTIFCHFRYSSVLQAHCDITLLNGVIQFGISLSLNVQTQVCSEVI